MFRSLVTRQGPLARASLNGYLAAQRAGHRKPIHFKDGQYDGEIPETFDQHPDMMAPDDDPYLNRNPQAAVNYFFGMFGALAVVGLGCYLFISPLKKEVVERDLPFDNLYLEYGGDPDKIPNEKEWRVRMGDRQAIYKAKHGDN
ncbi:hypothetical protein PPL_07987 [Heterostelium album PN500]|uniref:Uncharacterized protein n=1 Tax=Heterostelium pallidum (strain ATCC 26659 / Pp 5 / PN500) TaxID=670386 RepID=D3BHI5_HETP5|nr:hypothetical protein PPL_07987 [Heterostelium album PN500]EFA79162.1 hypothetical protein PPL_07987 [Heterostelium album PN500]|eukprot:XP_020431284.1 hypothetical protein PPL_07987 [Heterostelium album PN500]